MFSGNVGGIGGGNTAYDIDRLKNQITEQESDLSQKESDKSQTTTDLSTATSEATSLQTSLSDAETAISSASSALSSAQSARSSAESIEGEPIYDEETGEVIGMDFSKREAAIAAADSQVAEAQAQYDAAVQKGQ